MPEENKAFLSTQTIKDNTGSELSFINKIIFYSDDFNFLTTRYFVNGEWKIKLFEYDYNEKDMIANINIANPVIKAHVHSSITVPTVMIIGSQYTMYTYYIAKTEKLDYSGTNYRWYSFDEIFISIKDGEFTSSSIYNLRRFFELLYDNFKTLL